MNDAGQPGAPGGIGVFVSGPKQVGWTPAGRGPAPMNSLSWNVVLKFAELAGNGPFASFSGWKTTVPSPGWRGSPGPPQRATSSFGFAGLEASIATHPRLQVKP